MKRLAAMVFALFILFTFIETTAQGQGPASITIVEPGDRRNVATGNSTVTVSISGVSAGDGHYWELWLDGVPTVAVRDGQVTAPVIFEPSGPHRLKAILYDAQGNLLSSNEVLVIAAPVDVPGNVFNRAQMAPAMLVLVLVVIGIILLGLRLRPRETL